MNKSTYQGIIFVIFLFLLTPISSQQLLSADLKNHYNNVGVTLWNNFCGITIKLEEYRQSLKQKLFQDYFLNSNINGRWYNNWAISLQLPKDYHYNCSLQNTTAYNIDCGFEMSQNTTFFDDLGDFAYQAVSQPYWTMGFNNDHYDFYDDDYRNSFASYAFDVYQATGYIYHLDMIQGGDKMVENGYRDGNYTPQDFISEISEYEGIIYGVYYTAPGIAADASAQWKNSIQDYYYNTWRAIFTFECVIFKDPSQVTIQNILSDRSTTQYMKQLHKIDDSNSIPNYYYIRISKLALVEGDGIDGVTNSFAATIWFVDFVTEASLYTLWDVHYYSTGQFQRALGLAPGYKPSAIYMGMLFISLIMDNSPQTHIPTLVAGSSSKIKVWGLQTYASKGVLILNKDTNTSLDGHVKVYVQSGKSQKMKCTYLRANSFSSKIQDITLGGYNYIEMDNSPQGNYEVTYFDYNEQFNYYNVKIKYAESAFCQVAGASSQIPPGQCFEQGLRWMAFILLLVFISA